MFVENTTDVSSAIADSTLLVLATLVDMTQIGPVSCHQKWLRQQTVLCLAWATLDKLTQIAFVACQQSWLGQQTVPYLPLPPWIT